MEKTIKNVTYTNIPGDLYGLGISDTIIQTNISASGNTDRGNYVTDSTNFYPLIHAIDIDWDGIREGSTVINDTSDLITWIKSLPSSGAAGADGKSAYQSYLDTTTDSPKKTEAQWVASLKGADGSNGTNGTNGVDGTSVTISSINQNNNAGGTSTVTFSDGKTLSIKNGINGSNGTNGTNGVGIKSVSKTSGTGAAGTTDTYTVYNDNNVSVGTFTVYNGADGANGTGGGDVSGLNLSRNGIQLNLNNNETTLSSVQLDTVTTSSSGFMASKDYCLLMFNGRDSVKQRTYDSATVTIDLDSFRRDTKPYSYGVTYYNKINSDSTPNPTTIVFNNNTRMPLGGLTFYFEVSPQNFVYPTLRAGSTDDSNMTRFIVKSNKSIPDDFDQSAVTMTNHPHALLRVTIKPLMNENYMTYLAEQEVFNYEAAGYSDVIED